MAEPTTHLTIKTFVVLNANGRVVGVKLNRRSATALVARYPGGNVEIHQADKIETGASNAQYGGTRNALDEHRRDYAVRAER